MVACSKGETSHMVADGTTVDGSGISPKFSSANCTQEEYGIISNKVVFEEPEF